MATHPSREPQDFTEEDIKEAEKRLAIPMFTVDGVDFYKKNDEWTCSAVVSNNLPKDFYSSFQSWKGHG